MLPDFPTIKKQFVLAANQYEITTKNRLPLFSEAPRSYHPEGDKFRKYPEKLQDDGSGISSYEAIEKWFRTNTDSVEIYGHLHWAASLPYIVNQMIVDELRYHLNVLAERANRSEQITTAKKDATFAESCMDMLQGMDIEFDEGEKPHLPSAISFEITQRIIWNPELKEYYENKLNGWKNDPNYRARYEEIIERKRKDWLNRESNRKLVD